MTVKIASLMLTCFIVMDFTNAELQGFIVGGNYSKIKDFPHSVFFHIANNKLEAGCGASILNQAILLTAAHCVMHCHKNEDCVITAHVGSKFKYVGSKTNVIDYKMREFDEVSKINDIALLLLETDLELGKNVERIIVMRNPPKYKTGIVAGWGLVPKGSTVTNTFVLMYASQRILDRETCVTITRKIIPNGTFCVQDKSHVIHGDSGSALVVQKRTIQIGIVSYVIIKKNVVTAVYTDVPYYYDWIMDNARDLYCERKKRKQEKEESSGEINGNEERRAKN